jgi:hypothetical protein
MLLPLLSTLFIGAHALPADVPLLASASVPLLARPTPSAFDIQAAAAAAEGITPQQMLDAYPSRDPAKIANWYGTSLFGWKCVEPIMPPTTC